MKPGITKREREVTDLQEIIRILDTANILHLGMVDGDEPYVIPMNYGYTMCDGELTLYLHGATTGRKLDLIRKNPKVCFSLECDVAPFEGNLPCQYGTVYSSVMGRGIAEIVEDVELVSIVSVIRIRVSDYTAKHRPLPERLQEK